MTIDDLDLPADPDEAADPGPDEAPLAPRVTARGALTRWRMAEPVRLYLWPLVAAAGGILLVYGLVTGEQLAAWLAAAQAALGMLGAEVARGAVYSPQTAGAQYVEAFTAGREHGELAARDRRAQP